MSLTSYRAAPPRDKIHHEPLQESKILPFGLKPSVGMTSKEKPFSTTPLTQAEVSTYLRLFPVAVKPKIKKYQ
jgi:hypothetical protein